MNDQLARVIAHHDEWAHTYHDEISTMWLYNRITLDNILRFVPEEPGALILDAGGGTGFWSIELAKLGYHIVLTDISEGMLSEARTRISSLGLNHLIEIRNANMLRMPELADGQFAMVLCEGDPLSYCGDHHQAMEEMARVLQPGGALIASVDSRSLKASWLKDIDADAVARYLETGDVLFPFDRPENERYLCHTFTATELRRLFELHGLTVERIIGKTVLRGIGLDRSRNPEDQEKLYQLELRYCDHPDFVSFGNHLEIAGRKR
jgi:ubiquinone/menaquinone biosynthesis C-methylase UbiE